MIKTEFVFLPGDTVNITKYHTH